MVRGYEILHSYRLFQSYKMFSMETVRGISFSTLSIHVVELYSAFEARQSKFFLLILISTVILTVPLQF